MKFKFSLVVGILVFLLGCETTGPQVEVHSYNLTGHHADEFQLYDGTRCVVSSTGGIDCDWKNACE